MPLAKTKNHSARSVVAGLAIQPNDTERIDRCAQKTHRGALGG